MDRHVSPNESYGSHRVRSAVSGFRAGSRGPYRSARGRHRIACRDDRLGVLCRTGRGGTSWHQLSDLRSRPCHEPLCRLEMGVQADRHRFRRRSFLHGASSSRGLLDHQTTARSLRGNRCSHRSHYLCPAVCPHHVPGRAFFPELENPELAERSPRRLDR